MRNNGQIKNSWWGCLSITSKTTTVQTQTRREGLLSIRILWLLLLHRSPFSVVSLVGGLMQINSPFFGRYLLSCCGRVGDRVICRVHPRTPLNNVLSRDIEFGYYRQWIWKIKWKYLIYLKHGIYKDFFLVDMVILVIIYDALRIDRSKFKKCGDDEGNITSVRDHGIHRYSECEQMSEWNGAISQSDRSRCAVGFKKLVV